MSIELLAPAGNLEKLKMTVVYGADAVYIGGERFGLRAAAGNFNIYEMEEGVKYSHDHGVKVYLTVNMIPHNGDFAGIEEYIDTVSRIGVDAIIVSDPGVLSLVREVNPHMEIHLSTQANNTNFHSARFWYRQGVKRIVLARELSLEEIGQIRENVEQGTELEVFVHGAMCISYSGRCLLSNYMAGRDSNQGDCAQPCRWKYNLMEEKRPGEYMPIYENESGTFIFNSKDLCMIEHIPELVKAGVTSLKIEGRMKSAFYAATIVRAYRQVLDEYFSNPEGFEFNEKWLEEVYKVSHRGFTTGFFFGRPNEDAHHYGTSSYVRNYTFIGVVREYDSITGMALIEQRNRFAVGEDIEVFCPAGENINYSIKEIIDMKGNKIKAAPHPQMLVHIPFEKEIPVNSMLRRRVVSS